MKRTVLLASLLVTLSARFAAETPAVRPAAAANPPVTVTLVRWPFT